MDMIQCALKMWTCSWSVQNIHRKKNGSSKVAGSGAALLIKSTLKGIVTKLKLELNGVLMESSRWSVRASVGTLSCTGYNITFTGFTWDGYQPSWKHLIRSDLSDGFGSSRSYRGLIQSPHLQTLTQGLFTVTALVLPLTNNHVTTAHHHLRTEDVRICWSILLQMIGVATQTSSVQV